MRTLSILAVALMLAASLLATTVEAGNGGEEIPSLSPPDHEAARKELDKKNYVAAIELLVQVVAQEPRNADAFMDLGYCHRELNQKERALAYYKKALTIDPWHRGANEELGELYLRLGDLDKAKERLIVLDGACLFGCEEYDKLKRAIEAYQAKTGS
ncbi:MAG: tetratricopeptide repeat protein [Kiloniellales bacterium]|nr:tetratricopeptide repeat protein [Kiloniellales bacterium]